MNVWRIMHMVRKEFIQAFRDPRMRGVILVTPVIQMVLFANAVTTDVDHVSLAVLDQSRTPASRELISRFVASDYFEITEWPDSNEAGGALLLAGHVQALLEIPPTYAQQITSTTPVAVSFVVDATDSSNASVILGYAARVVGQANIQLLEQRLDAAGAAVTAPGQIDVRDRAWFNESFESEDYYVPGVVGMLITLITLMLTAMAVVREREIGTMEQIIVTPITRMDILLGKTIPFGLIGLFDATVVIGVTVFVYHVPLHGSLFVLYAGVCLYLLTTLSIGLLISTISETQQQAMITTFFFFLPASLLSGMIFPVANMPEPMQWATLGNPLRHLMEVLRGVFLKGAGFETLWPQMAWMAGIGLASTALTLARFRKTI